MVKKFISNLLSKKGEKADAEKKKSDDIPDELPPLAEDMTEEKKGAGEVVKDFKEMSETEKKGEEEVMDELPPLEEKKEESPEEKKEETEKTSESVAEPQKSPTAEEPVEKKEETKDDSIPKSLDSEGLEKEKTPEGVSEPQKSPIAEQPLAEEKKEETEESAPKSLDSEELEKEKISEGVSEPQKPPIAEQPLAEEKAIQKPAEEAEKGFFSGLLSFTQEQGINERILKQDLYGKMKDFWYLHPQQKEKLNKEKLEEDIINELSQLKRLEEGWIAQKNFLEDDKRILMEKQRDIISRSEKLQKILDQLKIYEDVPKKKFFWLNNKIMIKNINKLIDSLQVIDDKTFNHHVKDKKNDFSDWIKTAVGNKVLAEKVSSAKSREEMLVILENAALGNIYSIEPEEYFRMHDGKIIRNIKELIPALKEIDNAAFKTHVTNGRNDFASWIRNIYKNDYLADKLQRADSKNETVKILDEFCQK